MKPSSEIQAFQKWVNKYGMDDGDDLLCAFQGGYRSNRLARLERKVVEAAMEHRGASTFKLTKACEALLAVRRKSG